MSKVGNKEAGFTLVEVLCTISILGLLGSLALPNMMMMISKASLQQCRYEITSQLKEAQLLAMAKEMEVAVRFTNAEIQTMVNHQVISKVPLPKDTQIVSNYHNNKIVFQETGQVRGGTLFVKQFNKVKMKVVIQVASGTTKMDFDV